MRATPTLKSTNTYEKDDIKPIVGEIPKPDPKQPAAAEKVMLTWPIRALKLSSGFGHRVHPVTGGRKLHRGVDVPAPCGTEVVAVEDGTVVFSDWTDSAGNVIKLSHDRGWQTAYMHLARTLVTPGMKVKAGELLALSGSTGRLTPTALICISKFIKARAHSIHWRFTFTRLRRSTG